MRILPNKALIPILVTWMLGLGTNSVLATKMLHRTAAELTGLASRVLVGVCESVQEKEMEFPSNGSFLPYVEYTFQVLERLKGVGGPHVVLR